ncbi:sigma 54-interacting transcriptional regulator [Metabacillus sediminilitoris]|uniref:HTH-type transcriptional regulatory protein TyrR n=1 Tax=Metabacillus sediminilitoris TaxID=2567941 RepID=A0A4S4C436_9BACI|nr:sigma 54-interacting transcriptional regulator [Metabacillus sediminilitoris]QGQ45161.1 PAS domain-containing protein [Metabacillus sediminilitoris]THF82540.1 PAS domain-containing protein [Metabacillus sediminilitoris]
MFTLAKDKIRPIISLSIDNPEEDWHLKIRNHNEPFLFLVRKKQLVAYIRLKDILSNDSCMNVTIDTLLDNSVPIENICKLSEHISLPVLFQIIGESIALVKNEKGDLTGYIRREDVLAELFKQDNRTSFDLLKIILTSIPMGIFVVDREKQIVNCNESGLKMIKMTSHDVIQKPAENIFNGDHIHNVFLSRETILNQLQITEKMGVLVDYSPIIDINDEVEGIIIIVQDLPMVEEMAMEIEHIKNLNKDLNAILSTIYDEILVVNRNGELIRYSDSFISEFWGVQLKDLIGKSLLDLEDKGLFSPSVTRLVLEQKKKVSIVQETKGGKKILAVGNPVFDEDGKIERIIIASRDITETTKLKTELREIKKISDQYKQELDTFKNKDQFFKKMIYCSPKMEQIMEQVQKISNFSSTVLINGESGVGKEVIAQAIHQLGNRSNQPFLKLNCGAIPENLLESELFGYIKGSFTGADKNGKEGYFQKADQGILFLDEIGEMPLSLQVKLLRVLQEQEVIPIGSTTPIKINVQIVAATNKKLEKMVEQGTFREDLFYRLNVIPIYVPPLRERPEDIPLLAFHFLQQLNERYKKNYHLSPDALNLLEVYPWPGNIRELQNMIERLAVSADHQTIDAHFVNQFLAVGTDLKKEKLVIKKILPLQEALDSVEEQLILLAMKQYKTTTKAAKALGVSQSSVSRKYQKILSEKNNTIDGVFLK